MLGDSLRDTRSITQQPEWGRLRQGVLFSGATADGYDSCDVLGLVITAHCDLVHNKASVVNFLPVVALKDWVCRDGSALLCTRIKNDALNTIQEILVHLGYSPSILLTEPIESVIQKLLPLEKADKSTRAKFEKAHAAAERIRRCDSLGGRKVLADDDVRELRGIGDKTFQRILAELFSGSITGYYFLSCTTPGAEHSGHVVLLRQIFHLPRAVGVALGKGITAADLASLCRASSEITNLHIPGDAIAMPVAQVASPYLEHLMQTFGGLYTRIGLPDIPPTYQSKLGQRIMEAF